MEYSTRTSLELSVGEKNDLSVEVIVHLRRQDLKWWNDKVKSHQKQLFRVITLRILPEECSDDIEAWQSTKTKKLKIDRQRNSQKKSTATIATSGAKQHKQSKNNNSTEAKKKNSKKSSKKDKSDPPEFMYLYGDTIQLTYKIEDTSKSNSLTLLYNELSRKKSNRAAELIVPTKQNGKTNKKRKKNSEKEKEEIKSDETMLFNYVHKIKKRIIVWCYPFDPNKPTNPIPDGGGFHRTELIPIHSLFN